MKGSLYKALIGRTVLVPGSEFGVDVPELYYKGREMTADVGQKWDKGQLSGSGLIGL